MEHWLDGTQPDRPDIASGSDGDLFAARRTGTRTRAARAGSFRETADEPEAPRSEAVPALCGGTAPYPAFSDTLASPPAPDTDVTTDLFHRPDTDAADPFPGLDKDAADPFPRPVADVFDPFGAADAAAGPLRRTDAAGADVSSDDTDELTVQLGSIGAASSAGTPGGRSGSPDGTGSPVFVDESGRRSRRLRWLGAAVGVLCSVYALVIVATLVSGNSGAPWLPLPGLDSDTPAGKVETSAVPSASASPSGSADAVPGAGTTGAAATASSASGAAAEPSGAATGSARPRASALPEVPTTGTTTAKPTSPATASGPAAPESPAASPEASQPEGGGEASPTAVEDTGGTGETTGDANSLSSAG
ncbi:hypothetical protein Saso_53640 [Streptomyces asoensis]|uniref:Uncharacterized protein n=1 Tax=Streptomyces asoensis TaxID=249586 RepID=A0ABQ3S6G8_9ACTN|nr:hypothetical protein GCM10010496_47970 [Streptomyces asoensis]GHI63714.1 hypothetical protein Saso_53640 [Streptomyces asoensis]